MTRKRATIYDIAREAGVSAATVTRVLNGSASVREATRIRVQRVIDSHGYTPSTVAQNLGSGNTRTLGIILPSFAIILALSALLRRFYTFRAVRYAFMGIRAGVLALMIRALVSMYRKAPKNVFSYAIMALAFIVTAALPVDPVYVIIGCAVFGLVHSYVAGRREKE